MKQLIICSASDAHRLQNMVQCVAAKTAIMLSPGNRRSGLSVTSSCMLRAMALAPKIAASGLLEDNAGASENPARVRISSEPAGRQALHIHPY